MRAVPCSAKYKIYSKSPSPPLNALYALGAQLALTTPPPSPSTSTSTDVLSDDIFVNSLRHTKRVALLVSEEREEPVSVEGAENAKYICSFDPLDGSSNIDCNVAVGSIFGISRRAPESIGKRAVASEALQPGNALICAGYCCYGPSTQLVLCFKDDGVNVFTLDVTIGEFILSQPNLRIPAAPQKIYSLNEANINSAPKGVQRFVAECKNTKFSARYTGSMVSDVHRTLLYGGVFIYPATAGTPNGKLRVLYEVHPMAMLVEAAGGSAITGAKGGVRGAGIRALDLVAEGPHDRSGIILGCKRDVERIAVLLEEE